MGFLGKEKRYQKTYWLKPLLVGWVEKDSRKSIDLKTSKTNSADCRLTKSDKASQQILKTLIYLLMLLLCSWKPTFARGCSLATPSILTIEIEGMVFKTLASFSNIGSRSRQRWHQGEYTCQNYSQDQ